MGEILFLAHRVPFPPDRGDKIRGYHILHHLARHRPVHLLAFADDPRDLEPHEEAAAITASLRVLPRRKGQARAAAEALATGRPVSLAAFDDAAMRAAVAQVLAARPIETIHVYSSQMAQYVPADTSARLVMDFCDMDSAKFAAYAEDARGPMRWMMRREARLLASTEADIAARADASLFVSEAEAALFRASTGAKRVQAVENGIDTVRFDPAAVAPVEENGPLFVFTGQMDYRPNIDAVRWFATDVLPRLAAGRLAVVGRAPAAEVRALAGPRVIVTGEVADVRPWLAAAAVVVAPLKLARGVQNKVLEAMAMARPVVATPAAAEGIEHRGTLRLADDAAAFAQAIAGLLADPAAATQLGREARAVVQTRYGWEARLAALDAILGFDRVGAAA
ncbi:TIGR03087 family PEP-CTERM/XrtA system glycosyltransferase [Sphingomonas aracearum]|uniref:TIGR03087 family PEP-CTERM/XrtA system glycosyltransferase n=1 Tax=Sphingomonas aracearum TaxID=2283317 RepID=A0A369VW04_9SPHN|nr:TIGR03087 family PEP-CTERM/XrtA system glycosyltransferase [Sphingomonas aracearum]RDE06574.1 TIGR03087 family PEP-CTERM/XrtA system glycosyltransferase [Sphingomonas aracearum]